MNKIHFRRLLNISKALRESAKPQFFSMRAYMNKEDTLISTKHPHESCGTPACALGHYAARKDLQKLMVLPPATEYSDFPLLRSTGDSAGYDVQEVLNHFGITREESEDLFGKFGCGDAKTAIQAAQFIERFVAKKMDIQSRER